MTPLHPSMTLNQGDGESPVSFCSRVAQRLNRTARQFCSDMEISFQGIVDGNRETLEALATRCRANVDRLSTDSLVKLSKHLFSYRNQLLTREMLKRASVRVCPQCLLEDIEQGIGPYQRTYWSITLFSACQKHHIELVELTNDASPNDVYDFSQAIQPFRSSFRNFGEKSSKRSPSAFENYLVERINQLPTNSHWLQTLPFYAAVKVCQMIGAADLYGVHFTAKGLSEAELHESHARGFEIATQGEDGIREFLTQQQNRFFSGKADWGPKSLFGRVYEWLAHDSDDPAYDSLRDMIHRHVIETMPVGPGDRIFGREVTIRRFHSIHSAARETGTHPKRLRKLLQTAGYIPADSAQFTNDRVLFDAENVREFLAQVSETMSLTKAGIYLNAPRAQHELLFSTGYIQPFIPGGNDSLNKHSFAKRDLDAFLDRLSVDAQEETPDDINLVTLPQAAKRANCSSMEIVQLIFDRKLACVRRKTDTFGYLAVLVDPEEVKSFLKGYDTFGLTLVHVAKRLETTTPLVKLLINDGRLPARSVRSPVNHQSRLVVMEPNLIEFMSKFASVHTLAKERDEANKKDFKLKLDALHISPAFTVGKSSMPFYDRQVVANKVGGANPR